MLQELAQDRSKIYWFLSSFYLEPPNLAQLEELRQLLHTERGSPQDDGAIEAMQLLADSINSSGNLDALTQQLNIEYTRLFRGIKEGYGPPPPYESVYRESQLNGETTALVRACYRDSGYEIICQNTGLQDHISAELRFLALLCFDESSLWHEDNSYDAIANWQRQLHFLERHPLQWIPQYCDTINQQAQNNYYRAVAKLTHHTLDSDYTVVKELLNSYAL